MSLTPSHDAALPPAREAQGGHPWILLAGAAALGGLVAVTLGTYGRIHQPTGLPITAFGFSTMIAMKAWLATAGGLLGVVQVLLGTAMWGRLPGVKPSPVTAAFHRWGGATAFILTLPVAYHCLWSLGFQSASSRVVIHSIAGCAFYGLFTAKMLALRIRGLPSVVLPLVGGSLFALLAIAWATSALWFYTPAELNRAADNDLHQRRINHEIDPAFRSTGPVHRNGRSGSRRSVRRTRGPAAVIPRCRHASSPRTFGL